ncbi:SLAP domain-containing protein [Pelagirhabdus alkalitolerans]|uniref:SLAP domain-containing protein n=1 Tax=Pelagirhabdus alkalitolerans TaxID=1612202 RepID=A0A1G6KIV9_9BACI|nr:SLAP domain-containing protein [Pelagirhabdus alkalitolerans]SDC30758.1 SLAP domain-containing protein [Pelagirhabdus alkalitolerans]
MLQLQPKWAKTIDSNDLTFYENLYERLQDQTLKSKASISSPRSFSFTPLVKAFNHEEKLLIICFVTNMSDEPLDLIDVPITFYAEEHSLQTDVTIDQLNLDAGNTTLWTLIFENHPYEIKKQPSFLFE